MYVFQSLRLMRRPLLSFSSSYSGYLMAVTHQQQPVQVVVGGPGSGPGAPRGGLGGPRGASGGAWGSYLLPRKCPPERLGGHLLSSASLEGPWGLPGGSLRVLGGSLGAPRCPSGHPGGTLTIRVLTLEGLRGGLGGSKILPRPCFRDPRRSNVCISNVLSITLWI